MLILGGVICLVLAVIPLRTGNDTRLPVTPGVAVVLPSSGTFRTATLVLYGRSGSERPTDGALGCDVTNEAGEDMGLHVFTLSALGAGDRIIGNDTLTPLATVEDFDEGWRFTCTGPAASAAEPLYLLSERRRAIPRGVVAPFAVMCLALGTGALVFARRHVAAG